MDPGTLTILSEGECGQLQASFDTFASNTSNLLSAFLHPDGQALYGFKIATADFISLVSHVNVDAWKIRFGYKGSRGSGGHFLLTMCGADANGTETTDKYLLTSPVFFPVAPGTPPGAQTGVPPLLATSWLQAWQNLIVAGLVPHSIFQTAGGCLKGYDLQASHFVDAMQSATDQDYYQVSLVNHCDPVDPPQQPRVPGTFGVMLSAMKNNVAVSAYYDYGAPCPPNPM